VQNEYPHLPIASALLRSKDPGRFVILLEDTAAIIGLLIALVIGTFLAVLFPDAHLDAIASILIGALLVVTAIFLMSKTRSLLIGESADEELVDGIRELLCADERIDGVQRILTTQLAPDNVLLNLELRFRPGVVDGELPQAIDRVESAIRERFPELKEIFIEVKALKGTA
jgi:divalent metal cation (Fe/Co/Zn/Cd) transporter